MAKMRETIALLFNFPSFLILCPVSAAHNTFIPRLCYDEVLKSSLDIHNPQGYPIEIKEGKRIIHFSKMPYRRAITIYKEIIKTAPLRYILLQKFIDDAAIKIRG